MKSKRYDDEVTPTNTPRLREKTLILGMIHFFIGSNFLLHGVMHRTITVVLGVVFVLLVPIVVKDKRRENRGTFAVICVCIIHLCECVFLSVTSSYWWILVYILENIVTLIAAFFPSLAIASKKK